MSIVISRKVPERAIFNVVSLFMPHLEIVWRGRKTMRVIVIVLLMTALSFALDGGNSPWGGAISLGSLFTSGNTDVKQIDAGLELSRQLMGPVFVAGLETTASYGSQNDETYREKYLTAGTLRYDITENNFTGSRGYWTKDELAGISNEYGVSAGFGRRFINGESFQIAMDAGAGFLSRENTVDSTLETSIWYTGLDLGWNVTEFWAITGSARFNGDFQDSENYFMESVLEVSSSITGNLSFIMGYDITYYNLPPVAANEKTDTALRLQLRLAI